MKLLSAAEIESALSKGHLKVARDESSGLSVYNYTNVTQYERAWTPTTIACRGLVLDDDGNVIARSFDKFFNFNEPQAAAELTRRITEKVPYRVYEKIDGSMIMLFCHERKWKLATRGSFDNDQITNATDILQTCIGCLITDYATMCTYFNPNFTYIFEVVYPENKIVVDYGSDRSLYLTAVRDPRTGNFSDISGYSHLEAFGIKFPTLYSARTLDNLIAERSTSSDNLEGYVLEFMGGFRVKVKLESYMRLHKCLSTLDNIVVWLHFCKGTIDELLGILPDETYKFIHTVHHDVAEQFFTLSSDARAAHQLILSRIDTNQTRKDYAMCLESLFNTAQEDRVKQIKTLCFMLYDGKDISDQVKKYVRPSTRIQFKFLPE